MLTKEKVLKYLFVKAIEDTISEEIANNTLILKDIKKANQDFVDRVFIKFIEYSLPIFSINEILSYIRHITIKKYNNKKI